MNEYTRAPWSLWHNKNGAFVITDDSDSIHGATICARNDWNHRATESIANARLIAAAPELLAALKDIVAEIRAYQSPECDDDDAPGALELKAADAAIAKAEGATSSDTKR